MYLLALGPPVDLCSLGAAAHLAAAHLAAAFSADSDGTLSLVVTRHAG